jgi:hypothetical protein
LSHTSLGWGFVLDYRLYFLDGDGHIRGVAELDCASDAEAIVLAESFGDDRPMELWRRDRWIRRLAGHDRPSGISPQELPR